MAPAREHGGNTACPPVAYCRAWECALASPRLLLAEGGKRACFRAFYVNVEGGKNNVSLDKVFALADALGVDVEELFTGLTR